MQVGGGLPVLVVTDTRHAGKADGYAVGRVHLGFGELRPCDLPDGRLLQEQVNGQGRSINLTSDGEGHEYYCVYFMTSFYFLPRKVKQGHFQSDVFITS